MWQLSSCFPHFKYINTQRLISVAELKPSVKSGFSIFKAWAQSFGGSVETKLTGGLSRPAAYCHHDGKQEGSPHQAAVAAKRLGSALLPAVHIKAPHKLFFASLENFHDHTNRPHKLFSICFLYCLTSSFNYCFFFFFALIFLLNTSLFCIFFVNSPLPTSHKLTLKPSDSWLRFRLLTGAPAGVEMGVLTGRVISLPFPVAQLHCSRMTNVHQAHQQPSCFWLAVK